MRMIQQVSYEKGSNFLKTKRLGIMSSSVCLYL